MRTRTLVVALATLALAGVAPPIPIEQLPPVPAPLVSAESWILYDESSDIVLGSVDADVPRPMASTTKIMTALLAFESGRMDETVTVSPQATEVGEASIGLVAGERLPMAMLVNALMIRSGNDAATAVGEHLAGSVEGFVAMMNARAAELGLTSTSFANPHGLDAAGHHSSPRDLLTLARVAMGEPELAEIAMKDSYAITNAPDGTVRVAVSTNQLLETYRGTFGLKTGFTFQAGLVFVGGAERDGRRIWVVVMGSEGPGAHFADAVALLDHGFEDLRIVDTISRGTPFRLPATQVDASITAKARLHALALVGALAAAAPPAEPVFVAPPPDVFTPDVPGPLEALGWLFDGASGG